MTVISQKVETQREGCRIAAQAHRMRYKSSFSFEADEVLKKKDCQAEGIRKKTAERYGSNKNSP